MTSTSGPARFQGHPQISTPGGFWTSSRGQKYEISYTAAMGSSLIATNSFFIGSYVVSVCQESAICCRKYLVVLIGGDRWDHVFLHSPKVKNALRIKCDVCSETGGQNKPSLP